MTSQQLISALAQHTDSYWSFLLSFYVIAIYWGGHRRLMRSVGVFNANLVRDTVFLLLIVAALPFPTSVLGKYGGTAFALALYGAFNALATLALILLAYDVRRCDPAARAAETPADKAARWTSWLNLAVFLLCIPAGYLLGGNGPYVFLLLILTNQLPLLKSLAHRYRQASKSVPAWQVKGTAILGTCHLNPRDSRPDSRAPSAARKKLLVSLVAAHHRRDGRRGGRRGRIGAADRVGHLGAR